jgi:hypothetical protein
MGCISVFYVEKRRREGGEEEKLEGVAGVGG